MTSGRSLIAVALFALLGSAQAGVAEKPKDLAQRAAEAWLKQVDAGKYQDSWEQSAKILQGAVAKAKWEETMASIRKPLGKRKSRKLQSREASDALGGMPDGKYVVLKFATVFEGKGAQVETVTTTLEPGGTWRVAGYYVLDPRI